MTLAGNHIGNLNDRVYLGFGKHTLATSTFDVEAQDPQRSNFGPFSVGWMRDEGIISKEDLS
jgi:hypothetical protein